MSSHKIDIFNTGLMLFAFVLAIQLPFKLFLFAYAVLGPLHYLTEIHWLDQKNYFSNTKKSIWGLVLLSILICLAPCLNALASLSIFSFLKPLLSTDFIQFLFRHSSSFLFVGFLLAILAHQLQKPSQIATGFALFCLMALLLHQSAFYVTLFGVLLPTVIHVFVFTLLFMWYGALKSKSFMGKLNVCLLIVLSFLISKLDIHPKSIALSSEVKQNFIDSSFIHVHRGFAEFFNINNFNNKQYILLSTNGIKIQIFLAFAYTYHYLNWFSKTSIIKWHKIKRSGLMITLALWACSVILYYINYKLGFMALLFLSMLHVFLEFPLNVMSIKSIFKHYLK